MDTNTTAQQTVDFAEDLYTLRHSNAGYGNPYDPDSLLTGSEEAEGLSYSNSKRVFASEEDRRKAVEGKLSNEEVVALGPRVRKATETGFTLLGKQVTVKAFAYWHDGGDGGGSTTLFNTLEELREYYFKPDKWNSPEFCEAKYQSALTGDNSYENGEITETQIKLDIGVDGTARLARPLNVHYGQ